MRRLDEDHNNSNDGNNKRQTMMLMRVLMRALMKKMTMCWKLDEPTEESDESTCRFHIH